MDHKNDKLLVTNIQRMCFHDGPGIRTTVFLKGCSIRCPWCSNPENLYFGLEPYEIDGLRGVYGTYYSPQNLVNEILKDVIFWGEEGGVTFSGGEALMQTRVLQEVLYLLKKEKVHIAVETALFVPLDNLKRVISYIDYFIVDVKILNPKSALSILGGNITVYKKNVEYLYQSGKLKLFRVPCCREYTFSKENQQLLMEFVKSYSDIPIQIFAVHNLGEQKYVSLSKHIWKSDVVTESELRHYQKELLDNGLDVEIIKI